MTQKSRSALVTQAQVIRDETSESANTANRVGTMSVDFADSAMTLNDNFIDEDTFASDSATKSPSQQSVKAYVAGLIAAAWPLSGTADLAGNVTIDGNDFDLVIGSPNRINSYELYADAGILFDYDDGVDQSVLDIAGSLLFTTTSEIQFVFDNGTELCSLTLGETGSGGTAELIGHDVARMNTNDGVDSSNFDLLPTRAEIDVPFKLASYTVAGVPSASPAGQVIFVSDESGGAIVAFSDNTNWRRVTDGSIIS